MNNVNNVNIVNNMNNVNNVNNVNNANNVNNVNNVNIANIVNIVTNKEILRGFPNKKILSHRLQEKQTLRFLSPPDLSFCSFDDFQGGVYILQF